MKKNDITTVLLMTILSLVLMATVFSVFANSEQDYGEPELETFSFEWFRGDVSGGDASASDTVSGSDVSGGNVGYPVPGYDFTTDEITVLIPGLEREYTIAVVNDLHLITDHESGDVTEDNLYLVESRYENLSVTEEGVHAEELWPEVVNYLNYNDFDAVVFAGDALDYCSNSNIMALNAGLRELKYPADRIMYLRADHDYGGWYGGSGFTDSDGMRLQTLVLDGDRSDKCIEFDDFMIVGLNKSYRNISEDAHREISEKLAAGKPVILATHVPFYSEVDPSLKEVSVETRDRIYYWSNEKGLYMPDREMNEFLKEVYAEDSNVVQIIGGHIHARWDGNVTPKIREHVFAPTFEGKIGIVHVVGEEQGY